MNQSPPGSSVSVGSQEEEFKNTVSGINVVNVKLPWGSEEGLTSGAGSSNYRDRVRAPLYVVAHANFNSFVVVRLEIADFEIPGRAVIRPIGRSLEDEKQFRTVHRPKRRGGLEFQRISGPLDHCDCRGVCRVENINLSSRKMIC